MSGPDRAKRQKANRNCAFHKEQKDNKKPGTPLEKYQAEGPVIFVSGGPSRQEGMHRPLPFFLSGLALNYGWRLYRSSCRLISTTWLTSSTSQMPHASAEPAPGKK